MTRIGSVVSIAAILAWLGSPVLPDDRVVAYTIVNGRTIPQPLTSDPGDPEAGRKLYFDREATGCSVCHGAPDRQRGASDLTAPDLSGIGDRMDSGAIRMWLIAPRVLAPNGEMPGYYSVGQRRDEKDPLYGSTRLSAVEIEALVAFLAGQKAVPGRQ